jgi:hypothetical protein
MSTLSYGILFALFHFISNTDPDPKGENKLKLGWKRYEEKGNSQTNLFEKRTLGTTKKFTP